MRKHTKQPYLNQKNSESAIANSDRQETWNENVQRSIK